MVKESLTKLFPSRYGARASFCEAIWHCVNKCVELLRRNMCCPLFSVGPMKANMATVTAAR